MPANPLALVRVPGVERWLLPWLLYGELPQHLHTVVVAIVAYHLVYCASRLAFPRMLARYRRLRSKDQVDFCVHVVLTVQCLVILALLAVAIKPALLADDRVFGLDPFVGMVAALALGYFVWDACMMAAYVHVFGVGFVAHGVLLAAVFFVGMRPHIHYYAALFLLFEILTPFLNVRWFSNKIPGLLSDTARLANNIVLILLFAVVRIGYGWYVAYQLFADIRHSYHDPRFTFLPPAITVASNLGLNVLNVYWFYKMLAVAVTTIRQMINGEERSDYAHDEAKEKTE